MSGLAATGGETAASLLARFGVNGIRLVDEIEPGVSLGLTLGGVSVPVVTKAGAFGDEGSLTRIVRRLRFIRQKGVLA
jgi:D-threonate/D-erythronate kinase